MNNTNINESSNTEFGEIKSKGEVISRVPDLGWLTRFRRQISISHLLNLEAKIIGLIGDKANEAVELGMIPDELTMQDKNDEWQPIPFMGARNIIMWRDDERIPLITRNFKEHDRDDFNDFTIINLTYSEYELLHQHFNREYKDTSPFPMRDFCAYATDKMIDFQKMIDKIFQGQPEDTVLPVGAISDLEIRDMLCDLYNTGLDSIAGLYKVNPHDEFEDVE